MDIYLRHTSQTILLYKIRKKEFGEYNEYNLVTKQVRRYGLLHLPEGVNVQPLDKEAFDALLRLYGMGSCIEVEPPTLKQKLIRAF